MTDIMMQFSNTVHLPIAHRTNLLLRIVFKLKLQTRFFFFSTIKVSSVIMEPVFCTDLGGNISKMYMSNSDIS